MLLNKQALLPGLCGAFALALAVTLTGCGQSTDSGDAPEAVEAAAEETDEAAAEETDESGEAIEDLSVSDDIADAAAASKIVLDDEAVADAQDFNALPTLEDDRFSGITPSDLGESDDEVERAITNGTVITQGGLVVTIPKSWKYAFDKNELIIASSDEGVIGFVNYMKRDQNRIYDIEGIVQSMPSAAAKNGFTNIRILDYDTIYTTANDKLCGAYVLYAADYSGETYFLFNELVVSKSYGNTVDFIGQYEDFANHVDDVNDIVSSLAIAAGELA